MRHLFFHSCNALLLLAMAAAPAQDLEQAVRENMGSVLVITGTDPKTGALVQGSGSCVHPSGYVLATSHQIIGLENLQGRLENGAVFDLTPVEVLPGWELSLLKSGHPLPQAVRLGDARTLAIGAPLFAITTPVQLDFSLSVGNVSHPLRKLKDRPVIQAQFPVSPGSSGGPVFDKRGTLIGLVHGTTTLGGEWTVVIPINNAYALLRRNGIPVPLTPLLNDGETELIPAAGITQTELRAIDAYNRGVDSFDPEQKAAAYHLAVQLLPEFYEAQFNLAVALTNTGRIDEAMSAYMQASRLHPKAPEALRNLGRLHLRRKDWNQAASLFETTARLAPNEAQSYNDLGEAYRRLDKFTEAATQFNRALEINPGYAGAHFNLAITCARIPRVDEAIDHFKAYLRLSPKAPDREKVLAWIEQLGQLQ